jgi:hypothetical protein
MDSPFFSKATIVNTLHRQVKWLTEEELSSLAEQYSYEDKVLHSGWGFCHHIVHQGYLRSFVNFCKHKFDSKVKKRQTPPQSRIREVISRTIDMGSVNIPDAEKYDIFARSIDWTIYSEFVKQKIAQKKDLTNDEKLTLLVKRYHESGLDGKIMKSWKWRSQWLKSIDAIHLKIEDEEDEQYGYGMYGG